MKKFFSLLSFMIIAIGASAFPIKGRVYDETGTPLSYAEISLYDAANKVIDSAASDSTGCFKMEIPKKGDYKVVVSFLGMKSFAINLENLKTDADVGNIVLEKEDNMIKAGMITAEKIDADRIDRKIIYPTVKEKGSSATGFDLLERMMLPGIKVNVESRSVTSLISQGSTLLQINGVKATAAEISALCPQEVVRVDCIDNPGLRYRNDNIGTVIDIIVRKKASGFSGTFNANNAITVLEGSNDLSLKYDWGKSELGVFYSSGYSRHSNWYEDETTQYSLSGATVDVTKESLPSIREKLSNDLQLQYNYASDNLMVNMKVGGSDNNYPKLGYVQEVDEDGTRYYVKCDNRDRFRSPVMDFYAEKKFSEKSKLQFNAVATYLNEDFHYDYKELQTLDVDPFQSYFYATEGSKTSAIGELYYENDFGKAIFSCGLKSLYGNLSNKYSGMAQGNVSMVQNDNYIYSQMQGTLGKMQYSIGLGASFQHIGQEDKGYSYWLFRPALSLSYPIFKGARLGYDFSIRPQLPALSELSNITTYKNDWEIYVGNPDLIPYRNYVNRLSCVWQKGSLYLQSVTTLMLTFNADMPAYSTAKGIGGNDVVAVMGENQKGMHQLAEQVVAQFSAIPGKLVISSWGGFNRFWSLGTDYSKTLSAFYGNIDVLWYISPEWYMTAGAESRYPAFFGETVWHNEYSNDISIGWHSGNLALALTWDMPFQSKGTSSTVIIDDDLMYKKVTDMDYDNGNKVTFTLSWKFTTGRSHHSGRKALDNSDTDTGIRK